MTSSNQFEVVQRSSRVGNLSVGKLSLDQDWQAYTPTLTQGAWGTTTTNRWMYRIVGRNVEVKGSVVQTGAGTVGAGAYQLSLPTGCVAASPQRACGTANIIGATTAYIGIAGTDASFPNHIYVTLIDPTAATAVLTGWTSAAAAEIRLSAATLTVTLTCSIELSSTSPILAR